MLWKVSNKNIWNVLIENWYFQKIIDINEYWHIFELSILNIAMGVEEASFNFLYFDDRLHI